MSFSDKDKMVVLKNIMSVYDSADSIVNAIMITKGPEKLFHFHQSEKLLSCVSGEAKEIVMDYMKSISDGVPLKGSNLQNLKQILVDMINSVDYVQSKYKKVA